MKPFALVRQQKDGPNASDEPLIYACGVCGTLHSPKIYFGDDQKTLQYAHESAERCCKPLMCKLCGKPAMKHRTACAECLHKEAVERETKRIEAAEKVSIDACTGPVCYNDDEFFNNIENCIEHIADTVEVDEDTFPIVVWCCDQTTPQIDIDRWREDFEENLELADGVEVENVTTDFDEIVAAMNAWNAKQKPSLWMPSTKRCVLINKTDLSEET